MKKLVFSCLALLFLTFSVQAQEDPARAFKKAGNALKTFELDQTANIDKLHEAVDLIEVAMTSEELSGTAKLWQTQGDIYNAVANQIVAVRQLGFGSLDDLPQISDPALIAAEAYEKALNLAVKKYETKDALKGIRAVQTNLNNMGIYSFEDQKYAEAYKNFNGVLNMHNLLKDTDNGSMLETDEALADQLYIAGLAAINANNLEAAAPIFVQLKDKGADKPAIFESLYKIEAAEAFDPETTLSEEEQNALLKNAYPLLEEGRTKYPDDVSLLFAEINHFLRINELGVLITKIEMAIEKEPDNISLYSTMGNVYDNLFQSEAGEGNEEKANEYFNKSLEYYNQALAKDPNFTDATYSIGALYFNRAASMTQELTELSNDFSKEGQRKYDALQAKIQAEFETALPYFIDVEKKKPSDINTLLALKEIYARKSDFTLSNEFKTRLDDVQAGEQLESYFLNN